MVLTGRLKELINRGGEKISPLELDSALLAVQGVGEAVAFAVPDEKVRNETLLDDEPSLIPAVIVR